MGRGENNILFGQPPIVKKIRKIFKRGAFPSPVDDLIITSDFVLFRDSHSLRLLGKDMVADTTKTQTIPSSAIMAASGKTFAWGDSKGFFIHNLSPHAPANLPREALPGQPLGLYVAGEFLYCLWQDKESFAVSRTTTNQSNDTWEYMFPYESDAPPLFAHKGDSLLFLLSNDKKKEYSIINITENGPSYALEIHNMKVRGVSPNRLLAPTGRRGAYFSLAYTWHNNPEMMTLFKVGRPILDGSLGKADEKTLFSLDDLEGKDYLEVDSHEGRGVLLTDKELVLFTEDEGIIETFSLEEDDNYERVSFFDNRAILWSPGKQGFLEFDLS